MKTIGTLLGLGLILLSGCSEQAAETSPTVPKGPQDESVVVGQWLRPDGGYILEIKKVSKGGQAEAMYFNPNPIHVESALVTDKDGQLHLRLVLRDENYDGSTYELNYEPEKDVLTGTYFSPNAGQTYQVFFQRLKSDV